MLDQYHEEQQKGNNWGNLGFDGGNERKAKQSLHVEVFLRSANVDLDPQAAETHVTAATMTLRAVLV